MSLARSARREVDLVDARGLRPRPWLLAGLLAIGCLTPSPAAAQEWYELYGSGVEALHAGQGQKAASLLRRAIQKRPEPGTNVPTYGTNFEPRYFPYLRLADACLLLGATEDARKALETSARFGAEPAAERAALEARVRAALEATRPTTVAPAPEPAPAAASAPDQPQPAAPASGPTVAPAIAPTPAAALPAAPPPTAPPLSSTTTAPASVRPPGPARPQGATPGGPLVPAREAPRTEGPTPEPRPPAATTPPSPDGPALPLSHLDPWAVAGVALIALVAVVLWTRGVARQSREAASRPSTSGPTRSRSDSGTAEVFPMPFGDYSLVGRLGKGGMAVVYEAERRGERFALKRPLAGFLDDTRFRDRFLREADLGRTLHHPNIIRIFDRGEVESMPFFVMELVRGETLRERLEREGRLQAEAAARMIAQVAEALDYAHNKGVIHRDLKPSNVMLDRSGAVKVMDYGIARAQHLEGLTTTGSFLGTPSYAAPETVDAASQSASDLYSLGVVFFEMLTGTLPFKGDSAFAVMRKHCDTPPPIPSSLNYSLSSRLDRIVLRLLSKEPSQRPTAEQLLNELGDYLAESR